MNIITAISGIRGSALQVLLHHDMPYDGMSLNLYVLRCIDTLLLDHQRFEGLSQVRT